MLPSVISIEFFCDSIVIGGIKVTLKNKRSRVGHLCGWGIVFVSPSGGDKFIHAKTQNAFVSLRKL